MVSKSLPDSNDIVKIHHAILLLESLKDDTHHPLKVCWSIGKTHGHPEPFIQTFICDETSVWPGFRSNRYLPISCWQINRGI